MMLFARQDSLAGFACPLAWVPVTSKTLFQFFHDYIVKSLLIENCWGISWLREYVAVSEIAVNGIGADIVSSG